MPKKKQKIHDIQSAIISFAPKQIEGLLIGLDIAACILTRLEHLSKLGIPLSIRGSREMQVLRDATLEALTKKQKRGKKLLTERH
jgi:hypothetical protein